MGFAVISPVGISLFRRTFGDSFQTRCQQLRDESHDVGLWDATLKELQKSLETEVASGKIEESCAEIRSVLTLRRHRKDQVLELLILLPNTPESILCSRAVESYFKDKHELASLTRIIKGMDVSSSSSFQNVGIRTFLNGLSWAIGQCRQRGLDPVFNATPGYKAETSLALLLAQFVGASVFYIHETMRDRGVLLPSLPLTISREYWDKWGDLVMAIGRLGDDPEHLGAMNAKQFEALTDYRLRQFSEAEILFEDIRLDDAQRPSKTLSTIGQVLYEAHKGQFAEELAACDTQPEFKIKWPSAEHHWPRAFEATLMKIAKLDYVQEIRPKEFNQAATSGVSKAFDARKPGEMTCTHFGGDYGAEARILTTAKGPAQWRAARREIEAILIGYGQIPAEESANSLLGLLDTYGSVESIAAANKALQLELVKVRSSVSERLAAQRKTFQEKLSALKKELEIAENEADGLRARLNRTNAEHLPPGSTAADDINRSDGD